MKAKHIKRIREMMQTFLIKRSYGMFGDFTYDLECYDKIMARNPREATKRYCKRNHYIKDLNRYDEVPDESNEMFAKFRVLPINTPYDRFVTYWR
jgi:hypothetical protein